MMELLRIKSSPVRPSFPPFLPPSLPYYLTESWSFAAGWAMMELLRIKSSPVRPSLPPSPSPSLPYVLQSLTLPPSLPPSLVS